MFSRRYLIISVSALMLIGGIALVAASLGLLGGREGGRRIPPPQEFSGVLPTEVSSPQAETPIPEATPTPQPSPAALDRIQIASINVDAPIEVRGLDMRYYDAATRTAPMQDPTGPVSVAWYDFTGRPGFGSNAVFSGHVDYANYGAAVFWNLRRLEFGDEVKIALADGTTYTYKVVSSAVYRPETAPINEIVGPTEREVITLITCGGTFNPTTREYDQRLVVRAERVADASAQAR
jgi:LPXTG-site transpeptidase (sortase) family protein